MMWEGINLALNKHKKPKKLPNGIKDEKGNTINSEQNLANEFAKYFENVLINCKN